MLSFNWLQLGCIKGKLFVSCFFFFYMSLLYYYMNLPHDNFLVTQAIGNSCSTELSGSGVFSSPNVKGHLNRPLASIFYELWTQNRHAGTIVVMTWTYLGLVQVQFGKHEFRCRI